jgi:LysM repeat protein
MQEDNLIERFDLKGEESSRISTSGIQEAASTTDNPASDSRISLLWERVVQLGVAESILRIGTHLLSIALVLLVVWVMREFYTNFQNANTMQPIPLAESLPTSLPTEISLDLPQYDNSSTTYMTGITRLVLAHTTIPSRPRTEVTTYIVQKGDTIFGIAEKFGLKPETILWGNYYVLADNPHKLLEGQELNILPMDGTYHRWSAGEGINGVAEGYGVTPDVIIDFPGNHLNRDTLGDLSHPNIEPGTWLVIPGGHRQFITWSAPLITRDNPAVAYVFGPGACGPVQDGAVGTGSFIWPSSTHYLSGYDYSPETNHYAIDIKGYLGQPIWAADSGVIVYAGWNNFGYGNVVVIDHGSGWQTLYAHMDQIYVSCGQSVFQGTPIGTVGITGNTTGPHIHFEMRHYGYVNPHDFLPPP